jgi:hypothetical protein
VLLAMRGKFDEARAQWARAQALWEDLGMALRRAVRSIDASTIELLAGDAGAAERELLTGYDMLEEIGDVHIRPTVAAYLAAELAQEGAPPTRKSSRASRSPMRLRTTSSRK